MAIASKKPTILILAIYVELYILLSPMRPPSSGGDRISVLAQKDPDCPIPWSNLTSCPGRTDIYNLWISIIIQNNRQALVPHVGTWPPLS